MAYVDEAVYLPGRGAIYKADEGTEPPTMAELESWLAAGRTGDIGTDWSSIGYTSIDELPSLTSETEGGEPMAVWEKAQFRASQVTEITSMTCAPVQWDLETAKRRWGAGATQDPDTGAIKLPTSYTPTTEAFMVIFVDGDRMLVLHFYKASTSPEGDIAPDGEQFLAQPFKYTVLDHASGRGNILGTHMKTTTDEGEGA